MNARDWIDQCADEWDEPMLSIDGHDDAIVGICWRFGQPPIVIYDRSKVIGNLMATMTEEEAVEFFDYNIIGAGCGEYTPAFVEFPPGGENGG